jgi:hypothetical protein
MNSRRRFVDPADEPLPSRGELEDEFAPVGGIVVAGELPGTDQPVAGAGGVGGVHARAASITASICSSVGASLLPPAADVTSFHHSRAAVA